MLQSISDSIRNSKWLGWLIVSVITVPFALWGIGSYLGVGEDPYVAKVNGVEISARDYERAYYRQRNAMAQQFGGRLPPALAEAGFIKSQTVESLVTQQLLMQKISGSGYRVADSSLRDSIVDNPQFQIEGNFSKDAYERQLRSLGMGPQQYEENLRQALALEQMRNGVIATSFRTAEETAEIAKLRGQKRSVTVLSFKVDDFKNDEAVGDAKLVEYFEANAAQFFHPEAVKLEYLELDQVVLAEATEVEEEDLRKLYEEQRGAFSTPEKRYARHILIKVDNDADEASQVEKRQEVEELRERIVAGESFEDIAREYSQDPGSAKQGGDLGLVQRGVMVKPFEEAVFLLQEGGLSEPVKTTFGFHLIMLDRLEPGTVQTFDEVRDKLLEQQQLRAAENLFFDRVDVIANEAYENSDTLVTASEASGIAVSQTDWIERGGGSGIGEHPGVRSAAFSQPVLEQRLNSDMIEVGNNHVIVIRVSEHRERRAKTLEEVREEVAGAIVVQRAREAADDAAKQALEVLRDGGEAGDAAVRFNATLESHDQVARGDTEQDASLRSALFRMPRPQAGRPSYVTLNDSTGNPAVLVMHEVHDAEAAPEDESQASAPPRTPGPNEYNAWLEALKDGAEIERREELL